MGMKYDRLNNRWENNGRNAFYEARKENHRLAAGKLGMLVDAHPDTTRSTATEKYTKPVVDKTGEYGLVVRGSIDKNNPDAGVFLYDIILQGDITEEIRAQVYTDADAQFIHYPDNRIAEKGSLGEDTEVLRVLDAMRQRLDEDYPRLAEAA
jgi:hypothetical protein